MKRILAAFFLLAAFLLSVTCATTIPIVKDCSSQAVANLIDDVNTALSTGDYAGELAKLVAKFGECVIEKGVREVAEKAGLRGRFDDLEALKAQRARAWLESRGG